MGNEVITVRGNEHLPESWHACILLGDTRPSSKGSVDKLWQAELVELLQRQWSEDGRLVIILEDLHAAASGSNDEDYFHVVDQWHEHMEQVVDVAAYWWPAETDLRLMWTTLAAWRGDRPVVYASWPRLIKEAPKLADGDRSPVSIETSVPEMAAAILNRIGSGARRLGGERNVPLSVWRTNSFQRWYKSQVTAGNKLLSARLVWTFNIGDDEPTPLFWALHVRMHIGDEDRVKANEVVISRPDISVMMLYRPGPSIDETVIVLVREFRGPASTPDGLVHELPGGSGEEADELGQAISEAEEEIGLTIERQRVRIYDDRQLAATLSTHQAHLFAAEISDDELSRLQSMRSAPHGVASDTEQTWTEIATFREIRQQHLVDWATIGMISQVLLDRYGDSAGK